MKRDTIIRRFLVPAVVLIIGLLSISLLANNHRTHEKLHIFYHFDDMNHEVHTAILEAHLWLEEVVYGDYKEKGNAILANLDLAVETINTMLNGGDTFHDQIVPPLQYPQLRDDAKSMRASIIELKQLAKKKLNSDVVEGGDEYFDSFFNSIINQSLDLKSSFENIMSKREAELQRSYTRLSIVWPSLLLVVLIIILFFERSRNKSAEELEVQKNLLEKIVEDRTSELSKTNRNLNQEIDQKKRAERNLMESRETYKHLSSELSNILEAINDPIIQISPDFEVLWINTAASIRYGKSITEIKGKHSSKLCAVKSEPCEKCPTKRSFQTGRAENDIISTADGCIWEVKSFPIKGESESLTSVIEIRSDITEKIKVQEETIRAGQLASLGELAAGVAHEINNPINGIINLAQLMVDDVAHASNNDSAIQIMHEGYRISGIVNSLLSFARNGDNIKSHCSIKNIIDEVLSLLRSQLRKNHIKLTLDLDDNLPYVNANFQQIEQVFLNIISNAQYSLNERYPGAHDDKVLEINGKKVTFNDAPYVHVEFCDYGTGIGKDLVDKVTNPFFTTKPRGSGTGLGLSISQSIIADHGGFLKIDTAEGKYTKVITGLPAINDC